MIDNKDIQIELSVEAKANIIMAFSNMYAETYSDMYRHVPEIAQELCDVISNVLRNGTLPNKLNHLLDYKAIICDILPDTIRVCTECGDFMNQGYCVNGGDEYYCDDECLHKHITLEEWEEMYDDGGDSYWTEWV